MSTAAYTIASEVFDDLPVRRALSYFEPVLVRAERAGVTGAEAERWANCVYLVHRLLRDRGRALATRRARRLWLRHYTVVRDLVSASVPSTEQAIVADLLAEMDPYRPAQPATPEWLAARQAYVEWLDSESLTTEALAVLALTTGAGWDATPADCALQTLMLAGRLYRRLARWDAADRAYAEAHDVATRLQRGTAILRAELGHAIVTTNRGNIPLAITLLRDLYARCVAEHDVPMRAAVAQDLAVALERGGDDVESLAFFLEALQLQADAGNKLMLLGNIGTMLCKLGQWDAGLQALECVRTCSDSWRLRTNAAIDALPAIVRKRHAEFRVRATALLEELPRMAPSMRCDCRYQVAAGLAQLGDPARARQLLADALAEAAEHQLHEWYFKIEASARELLAATRAESRDPVPSPRLAGLMAGVRQFANEAVAVA